MVVCVSVSVCEIPEPAHVSTVYVCIWVKGVTYLRVEMQHSVFAEFKPYLATDRPVKRLFFIDTSRSASPSGLKFREHTNLSDYEGGEGIRKVWNVFSSFPILIFTPFFAPDHPELLELTPAFRALVLMTLSRVDLYLKLSCSWLLLGVQLTLSPANAGLCVFSSQRRSTK